MRNATHPTCSPVKLWTRGMFTEWVIASLAALVSTLPATDVYFHDSDLPFGPIRFAILALTVFGSFAALYYCWPKLSRRRLDHKLASLHFWGTVIFFNLAAIPMLLLGIGLHQPRMLDPRVLPGATPFLGLLAILGLCGLLFYQLPFVWAVILSLLGVSCPAT